jgi:hypothetical protein
MLSGVCESVHKHYCVRVNDLAMFGYRLRCRVCVRRKYGPTDCMQLFNWLCVGINIFSRMCRYCGHVFGDWLWRRVRVCWRLLAAQRMHVHAWIRIDFDHFEWMYDYNRDLRGMSCRQPLWWRHRAAVPLHVHRWILLRNRQRNYVHRDRSILRNVPRGIFLRW